MKATGLWESRDGGCCVLLRMILVICNIISQNETSTPNWKAILTTSALKNQPNHYASALVWCHWLTLAVIVAVYVLINLHDAAPKGSDFRALMKHWHYIAGLSVLLLVTVRLWMKYLAGSNPAIDPRPAPYLLLGSKLMHLLLYAFLIGMPLLGWVAISAGDKVIPLHLPALIAVDLDFYKELKGIHKTIGTLGYWLIGLHAALALLHHYWLNDNTLRRMLPNWRR